MRDPLLGLQDGQCFYCGDAGGPWDVDHFLPWARWPDDGLDNLVVAHRRCNNDKRAALPGIGHLSRWWGRFHTGSHTSTALDEIAAAVTWPRRPTVTAGAARALYLHQPPGAMLWAGRGAVEALDEHAVRATLLGADVIFDEAAETPVGYDATGSEPAPD